MILHRTRIQPYIQHVRYTLCPECLTYLSEGLDVCDRGPQILSSIVDLRKLFASLTTFQIGLCYGSTVLSGLSSLKAQYESLIAQRSIIKNISMCRLGVTREFDDQIVINIRINKVLGEAWMKEDVMPAPLAVLGRGWNSNMAINYQSDAWIWKDITLFQPKNF
jgi:hypothetical protein